MTRKKDLGDRPDDWRAQAARELFTKRTIDGVAVSNHPLFAMFRYIQRYSLDAVCREWAGGDVESVANMIEDVLDEIGPRPSRMHELHCKKGSIFRPGNVQWVPHEYPTCHLCDLVPHPLCKCSWAQWIRFWEEI